MAEKATGWTEWLPLVAREGVVVCIARPLHQGRTTQVWGATMTPEGSTKPIAQFRNMQLWLKA